MRTMLRFFINVYVVYVTLLRSMVSLGPVWGTGDAPCEGTSPDPWRWCLSAWCSDTAEETGQPVRNHMTQVTTNENQCLHSVTKNTSNTGLLLQQQQQQQQQQLKYTQGRV